MADSFAILSKSVSFRPLLHFLEAVLLGKAAQSSMLNHLWTDDEILVKIFISTMADDKIHVIRSTYI